MCEDELTPVAPASGASAGGRVKDVSRGFTGDVLAVFAGGFLGALASTLIRTFVSVFAVRLFSLSTSLVSPARVLISTLPLLAINVLGSGVLGFLVAPGRGVSRRQLLFWGTGMCGALTTYGSFALNTVMAVQYLHGVWLVSIVMAVLMLVTGFGAAALGWKAASRGGN